MSSVVVASCWTVVRQNNEEIWVTSFADEKFIVPRTLLEGMNFHNGDVLEAILTCNSEMTVVTNVKIERILSSGKKSRRSGLLEKLDIIRRMIEGG